MGSAVAKFAPRRARKRKALVGRMAIAGARKVKGALSVSMLVKGAFVVFATLSSSSMIAQLDMKRNETTSFLYEFIFSSVSCETRRRS